MKENGMELRPLERAFFERDTLIVAKELVGKKLVRKTAAGEIVGTIVETEGYLGYRDDAAHTYKGRTERTAVAFGQKGRAYIYLIYGMYCCLNVTAGPEGEPELVLIRALKPEAGLDMMRANRPKAKTDRDLCRGPGRLCQALSIDRSLYGTDVCEEGELYFADVVDYGQADVHGTGPVSEAADESCGGTKRENLGIRGTAAIEICASPRIGIEYAEKCRLEPWRFFEKDSPFVSGK